MRSYEPKIKGTILLTQALADISPDFICYFSSTAAVLGDFGACDYAVANRFQIHYAAYQNLVQTKTRVIAIAWPLWKDGGMGFEDSLSTEMYLKSGGLRLLGTKEGLELFDNLISQQGSHHLIMAGQPVRIKSLLGLTPKPPRADVFKEFNLPDEKEQQENVHFDVKQRLIRDLKRHISQLLKISLDELDGEVNLADFGFDSISLVEFASRLTAFYHTEITPAVFFGHSTIEKLSEYFLTQHDETILNHYKKTEHKMPVSDTSFSKRRGNENQDCRICTDSPSADLSEPIAIIGMSGRFPMARNIQEMWEIMLEEKDAYGALGKEGEKRGYFNRCGLMPAVDAFDALFFEISPEEAESMDPRQRVLLEESWKALEDAGYGASQIQAGKIGVFIGAEQSDWQLPEGEKSGLLSGHDGILASRLSYFLNLDGPAMALNTSCSSGLVAAHLACQSLRNRECDTAVAGAVNIIFSSDSYIKLDQAGMLSPSGVCRAFDNSADGMVLGEAVVAVVLKRLSKARADMDPIYAVIKGSGINYDGKTNGITAPSASAQTSLLKSVYDRYRIDPENIEYIVTHGTGTKLSDPVEIKALDDAFKLYTPKRGFCAITSPKTNFGHCLAASGLLNLVVLVQSLRHKIIPANLHFQEENRYINWKESPFFVNKAAKPWDKGKDKVLTGAVSAFGMSGTNAHMVVESYLPEDSGAVLDQAPYFLMTLSAKTRDALQAKIEDMIVFFRENTEAPPRLSDVCTTLSMGRLHFRYRLALVVRDHQDVSRSLQQAADGVSSPDIFKGEKSKDVVGRSTVRSRMKYLIAQSRNVLSDEASYKEMLCSLAGLYCRGYELLDHNMYGVGPHVRLHLPTYPFARTHDASGEKSFAQDMEKEQTFSEEPEGLEDLRAKVFHRLKLIFAQVSKFGFDEIDFREPFESYGIDSIMITKLNEKLGAVFGELSKTLFYEYENLGQLTDYLISSKLNRCIRWISAEGQEIPGAQADSTGLSFNRKFTGSTAQASIKHTSVSRGRSLEPDAGFREPIAIVGISSRYPHAETQSQYWENLKAGRDCITEISERRWSLEEFFYHDPEEAVSQGKSYSKWGGFIDGFADFDPLFFNISPKEALNMDPQERLFIQSCWEAFEDAGYNREEISSKFGGNIGVFAGVTKRGFELYGPDLWKQGKQIFPYTSFSSVANRISYIFNLHGPSMPIDTMCSASLTAIHEACEHLLRGECEMALSGGVNLYLHPSTYVVLCRQMMLSTSDKCRSFGKGGDGFVPGEGTGVVLLKRLSDAVRDGDHVYAKIIGTAVNHDGKTSGYMVPNPGAQMKLICSALDKAGIDARTVSYIEAHGTGTELGDPIEITGLTRAFEKYTHDKQFCAIGSVKSNIGHLEAAAGIAGLAKIVLQIQNRMIAPSLHCHEGNPNINFEDSPFVLQEKLGEWKRPIIDGEEVPRRAGISSFGAGGANAHILIEEYFEEENTKERHITIADQKSDESIIRPYIIVLSARNLRKLREKTRQLATFIEKRRFPDADFANMAYTLQVGREALEERLAMVVESVDELKGKLEAFCEGRTDVENVYQGRLGENKDMIALFSEDKGLQKNSCRMDGERELFKTTPFVGQGIAFRLERTVRQGQTS